MKVSACWTSATYDHTGRLLRATFSPFDYNPLDWRAPCRKCKARPGGPCVTPRGWGTRTHAARSADARKMRESAARG